MKMNKNFLFLSVDAGRSGIKSAKVVDDNKYMKQYIPSKFGYANFTFLKTLSAISFNREKDLICKVDNDDRVVIYGETCEKLLPPEQIRFASTDEVYLKYAGKYTLVSIANLMQESENGFDAALTINLTYNNMNHTEDVIAELKGQHTIIFYDTKGTVIKTRKFNITKIAVYYQGETSVMYVAINDKLEFNPKYAKDGIYIDVGRKTTDVGLVRNLDVVKPFSYELATEDLFVFISEKLYERYKIRSETKDIEMFILNKSKLMDKEGNEIDLTPILKEAILYVSDHIQDKITENFGSYISRVEWVLLSGGGTYYFKDLFSEMYKKLEIVDDPVFSNCLGMAKLLLKFGNK